MNYIFLVSFLLIGCTAEISAPAPTQLSFFLEIKNPELWPHDQGLKFLKAAQSLSASKKCWQTDKKNRATSKQINPQHWCSRFFMFESNEQLKPYSKIPQKIKLVFSYLEKNSNSSIAVQRFCWNGEKTYSCSSSNGKLHASPEDFIVLWSQK